MDSFADHAKEESQNNTDTPACRSCPSFSPLPLPIPRHLVGAYETFRCIYNHCSSATEARGRIFSTDSGDHGKGWLNLTLE